MEPKQTKPATNKPRMGRPPQTENTKKGIELSIDGDYVTIRIPKKGLLKQLVDAMN